MKNIACFVLMALGVFSVRAQPADTNALALSQDLFLAHRAGHDYSDFKEELAGYDFEKLAEELYDDDRKKAFWINIYNVYAQIALDEYDELYENKRRKFFKVDFIVIAGKKLSLNNIHHGILRRSQTSWGWGHLRKWFPGKEEKMLRTDERDERIHFALNCGIENCPAESYFEAEELDEQLESAAKKYIVTTTEYSNGNNVGHVSKTFSRYRGDFGGKSGIRKLLKKHGAVPPSAGKFKIEFREYDWAEDTEKNDENE